MRFAISSLLVIASFYAAPLGAQTVPIDLAAAAENGKTVRLQTGKNIASLRPADGLLLQSLTNGLGEISALAQNEAGTLFVADRKSGRLWRLPDRNQDGRFDSKQALPQRFDGPSGLAVYGRRVYVADRNAVWVMDGAQPPEKLAGLLQAGSKGIRHPLAISQNGQTLYLGLTKTNGDINLLSIDTQSGAAALLQKAIGPQDIVALAVFGDRSPWVATAHAAGPSLSQLQPFHTSHSILAMALPVGTDWPAALNDHLVLSRQSGDGFDVLALPTGFGQVGTDAATILSGFLSPSGRTAWGLPGALLFDAQGLIIADTKNGDLYRVSPQPAPIAAETPDADAPPKTKASPQTIKPPQMQVSTLTQGSQIGPVSSLNNGTSIDVGSTIIRDYTPLTLEDEAEDDSAQEDTATRQR